MQADHSAQYWIGDRWCTFDLKLGEAKKGARCVLPRRGEATTQRLTKEQLRSVCGVAMLWTTLDGRAPMAIKAKDASTL